MEANYENHLLHTKARWLSRGKVLSRVYEWKEEMLAFFSLERQGEFCNLLCDDSQEPREGRSGGTMTPGLMDFRGP